jgi:hypothetical protein
MRLNGQVLVLEMAVRKLDAPLVSRYRKALILGALREDVYYVPFLRIVFEHLSLSHFYGPGLPGGFLPFLWPGARWKVERFFSRAVARYRQGQLPAAFLELGRACHVLTDMACPVHVHRVAHDTDPYEWYVDAHVEHLARLDVPSAPLAQHPSELVEGLARFTRQFAPDRTHNLLGRWMRRLGLRRPLPRGTLAEQAERIIPVAAGHAAGLLHLFLRATEELGRAQPRMTP